MFHKITPLLVLTAYFFFICSSHVCGGNCPSGDCILCPCGLLPKKIDIDTFCKKYDQWNFDCCKCIVEKETGGNAHFSNRVYDGRWMYFWYIGVLPISDYSKNNICNITQE